MHGYGYDNRNNSKKQRTNRKHRSREKQAENSGEPISFFCPDGPQLLKLLRREAGYNIHVARADQDGCGGDGEVCIGINGDACAVFLPEATNIIIAETSAIQKP